jgi:hypothetical protein
MSSAAAPATSASEAIAAFAVAEHAGEGFDEARRTAEARLAAARAVLVSPRDTAERAGLALASLAPVLRQAFVAATALTAVDAMREDAAIIGAVLAAGEYARCDNRALAEAIAVGREIAARLRGTMTFDAPWDVEAVADRLGAAAAAARLARLDAGHARHALGLAATQAAGLGVAEPTPAGFLARGKAAFDAVEDAALARAGFTSASASIEGRRGLAALMASSDSGAALIEGLGTHWFSV